MCKKILRSAAEYTLFTGGGRGGDRVLLVLEQTEMFYFLKVNIMPWSSPCKCPVHIMYGTAIGVLEVK